MFTFIVVFFFVSILFLGEKKNMTSNNKLQTYYTLLQLCEQAHACVITDMRGKFGMQFNLDRPLPLSHHDPLPPEEQEYMQHFVTNLAEHCLRHTSRTESHPLLIPFNTTYTLSNFVKKEKKEANQTLYSLTNHVQLLILSRTASPLRVVSLRKQPQDTWSLEHVGLQGGIHNNQRNEFVIYTLMQAFCSLLSHQLGENTKVVYKYPSEICADDCATLLPQANKTNDLNDITVEFARRILLTTEPDQTTEEIYRDMQQQVASSPYSIPWRSIPTTKVTEEMVDDLTRELAQQQQQQQQETLVSTKTKSKSEEIQEMIQQEFIHGIRDDERIYAWSNALVITQIMQVYYMMHHSNRLSCDEMIVLEYLRLPKQPNNTTSSSWKKRTQIQLRKSTSTSLSRTNGFVNFNEATKQNSHVIENLTYTCHRLVRNCNLDFITVPYFFQEISEKDGHANLLVIRRRMPTTNNTTTKNAPSPSPTSFHWTVEHIEPHGNNYMADSDEFIADRGVIAWFVGQFIEKFRESLLHRYPTHNNEIQVTQVFPDQICPTRNGIQTMKTNKLQTGSCMIWALLCMHLVITHPEYTSKELYEALHHVTSRSPTQQELVLSGFLGFMNKAMRHVFNAIFSDLPNIRAAYAKETNVMDWLLRQDIQNPNAEIRDLLRSSLTDYVNQHFRTPYNKRYVDVDYAPPPSPLPSPLPSPSSSTQLDDGLHETSIFFRLNKFKKRMREEEESPQQPTFSKKGKKGGNNQRLPLLFDKRSRTSLYQKTNKHHRYRRRPQKKTKKPIRNHHGIHKTRRAEGDADRGNNHNNRTSKQHHASSR